MTINKSQIMGLIAAATIIIVSGIFAYLNLFNVDIKIFYFVAGIAMIIAGMPFFTSLLVESQKERSIDAMFLEFARDLVEGVKSGTPISKSIINVKTKNYGSLSPHVDKLANQIALGIPVKDALDTFAKEVNSQVISRAISLIREAERSGGRIEVILESVSYSISQIEKLKKERKAAIYNLTVQGYIIFFIFIIIMLIMEFKILPMTSNLNLDSGVSDIGLGGDTGFGSNAGGAEISPEAFAQPFLFLLLFQGFFAGLVIGKISEGSVKAGLKHSFVLVAVSWIISSGANIFLNPIPVGV
jgi:flagellar protein FlaJ